MFTFQGGTLALLAALLQNEPRDCGSRETEPAQFANHRGGIEWGSDADRHGLPADSSYGFSRFIANRGTEPLLVHWEAGRLLLPSLPPGYLATLCERLPMRPYMIFGPIAIERGTAPVQTTVWEAGYDAREIRRLRGRPLETVFTMAPEEAGDAGRVALRVTTTLLPGVVDGEFTASYAIENRGTDAVEVTWPLAPATIRELGLPRVLGPRASGSESVSWKSEPGLPVFVHVPLMLSAPAARATLATVTIPTFVVRESGPN